MQKLDHLSPESLKNLAGERSRDKASERQRSMLGNIHHIQTCTRSGVFDLSCFYNPQQTKASERRRAMLGKTHHIQTCT